MSYISPTSDIYLFYGVPLDIDYRNTFYWDKDTQTQNNIFTFLNNNYRALAVNSNTYQRAHRNSFRIGVTCDDLYDINYMAFRNPSFGDRWFFAFVTQVDYVNNNTSEITYQIDVIQTWWFDWDFCDCFVVREHSETDSFGSNLQAEPVNISEPVFNKYSKIDTDSNGLSLNDYAIYVTFNPIGNTENIPTGDDTINVFYIWDKYYEEYSQSIDYLAKATTAEAAMNLLYSYNVQWVNNIYNWLAQIGKSISDLVSKEDIPYKIDYPSFIYNTYSGLVTFSVEPENAGFIDYFIDYVTDLGKFENIVSIYTAPREIRDGKYLEYDNFIALHNTSYTDSYFEPLDISATDFVLDLTSDTLDGYKPKNKKLWTYPYNYIICDNGAGQSLPLRFEYFPSYAPKFYVTVNVSQPAIAMLQPKGYRMINGENETEINAQNSEFLTLTNYPVCSWVGDYYQQWIARYGARENYELLTGVMGGLTTALGTLALTGIAGSAGSALLSGGSTGVLSGTTGTSQKALTAATPLLENSSYSSSTSPWITREGINNRSVLTGNMGTSSGQISNTISNYMLNRYENSHMADYSKGTTNMGSIQFSNHRMGFYIGRVSLNAEQAEIIDNYFTMFGYAANQVKEPNYSSRPYFNYVQTAGCNIKPRANDSIEYYNNAQKDISFAPGSSRTPFGMSANDKLAVQTIFDNGITLWKTKTITEGYYIGDYSVDNSV